MARAYFVGTVTQGSADAFAVASFATALTGLTNQAALVREIAIEFSGTPPGAADANLEIAVTRYTKAAMPLITDPDVLVKVAMEATRLTSGATIVPTVHTFKFSEDDDLKVIEDPLYISIDTNGTSAQNTALVRIAYELARITTEERIALLQNALS